MWAVDAVAAFFITAAFNFAVGKFWITGNVVIRFATISGVIGIMLTASLFYTYGFASEAAAAILIFAFACELYVFLFTLALSSVSVNIMLRLKQGPLSERELDEMYGSAVMIGMRIDRLLQSNLLQHNGYLIEATARGQRLTSMFNRFRMLFGHS